MPPAVIKMVDMTTNMINLYATSRAGLKGSIPAIFGRSYARGIGSPGVLFAQFRFACILRLCCSLFVDGFVLLVLFPFVPCLYSYYYILGWCIDEWAIDE